MADWHGIAQKESETPFRSRVADCSEDAGFRESAVLGIKQLGNTTGRGFVCVGPFFGGGMRCGRKVVGQPGETIGNGRGKNAGAESPGIEGQGDCGDMVVVRSPGLAEPFQEGFRDNSSPEMEDGSRRREVARLDEEIGMLDDARTAIESREGIGDHRPSQALRNPGQQCGDGFLQCRRECAHKQDAIGNGKKCVGRRGECRRGFRKGRGRGKGDGFAARDFIVGEEGFVEGAVDVNGTGQRGEGVAPGGVHPFFQEAGRRGKWEVDLPADFASENAGLVDGLICAGPAQACGAVGGEEDEGDRAEGGFDDRWPEIGDRRA